ncbi:MAG: glycosyltransferase family 39 protein [Bacteroidales bacterium]|jgi:hypothetical protein|nr:glycosyltransferase family 39 protein [Bacteroidales bacterium]
MSEKPYTKALPYLFICLACLSVYFSVVGLDFQRGWDDGWMVMNHYTVFGFTPDNLKAVFTEFYVGQYGPLNELVYMAIYATFGYNAAVYHLYPLLLHIINSCLVLLLIRRLIGERMDKTTAQRTAFVAALLFAVHPIQVETIAWISASKIPLYTFFALLSMLAYIRHVRTGKVRYYIGAFLLFVCAFGSKEQSVVLPAVLLLLDWALGRTPLACEEKSSENSVKSWGYLLLEKMPFIFFALFAGLCTFANQSAFAMERWAGYPLWQRLVFSCYALVEYFGKLVFPVNLLYLYPFPMAPGKVLPVRFLIYPVIVVLVVGILIRVLKRKDWPVIFGLIFFFINTVLMLHIIPMSRFAVVADRYVYLASVGLFFIAAWYAVPWLQKMATSGKKWVVAVAACWLLYLGGYAHFRTYTWKNSDTLKKELRELIHTNGILKQQDFQEQ